MSQEKTRRELALLATGGLVASGLVLASAKRALAEPQPVMERAKAALEEAYGLLHNATADKGGHRVKAMNLIRQAIGEVDEGIHFDNANPYR